MKTLNDFLIWLAVCGLLRIYWDWVEFVCFDRQITLDLFIRQMDANNPDTLFDYVSDLDIFREAKIKYTNWLKT